MARPGGQNVSKSGNLPVVTLANRWQNQAYSIHAKTKRIGVNYCLQIRTHRLEVVADHRHRGVQRGPSPLLAADRGREARVMPAERANRPKVAAVHRVA